MLYCVKVSFLWKLILNAERCRFLLCLGAIIAIIAMSVCLFVSVSVRYHVLKQIRKNRLVYSVFVKPNLQASGSICC